MQHPAFNSILDSKTCLGAFQVTGDGLAPLKAGSDAVGQAAARTRDLWASMGAVVSDAGLMIAKRADAVSVAMETGGVILETTGPVNIGILRSALQREDVVRPAHVAAGDVATAPGPRAVWALARWIEKIETTRLVQVSAGEADLRLWARKGRFGLEAGQTPAKVTETLLAAGVADAPITLTYGDASGDAPAMAFNPVALFDRDAAAPGDWVMAPDGCLSSIPAGASLAQAAEVAALAARLSAWSEGAPFEVTIQRTGGRPELVAHASTPAQIVMKSVV